jgi:DNA-binding MarR family transcriptional regulator
MAGTKARFEHTMVDLVIDLGNYPCYFAPMADLENRAVEGLRHRGDEPHLLREVFRTYQVLMAGFARQTGMPASRFALMRLLALSEGGVGLLDLARLLGVDPAAISRQVRELEAEHLVKRRTDARDGRRSYITLSPEGLRQFEEIHERSHELERSLSAALGAEEMAAAATTLVNLRTFFERSR